MNKFDLSFDFKDRHYDAAIRVRQKAAGREFAITALDWNLERLLYGNHIIREVDGTLQANVLVGNKEQTELKLIIASRLSEYLKIRCFVGEQCLMANPHEESWEELHPIPRHEHDRQNASGY
jgi:hypothetical protein